MTLISEERGRSSLEVTAGQDNMRLLSLHTSQLRTLGRRMAYLYLRPRLLNIDRTQLYRSVKAKE
jgi:hypothetical protein